MKANTEVVKPDVEVEKNTSTDEASTSTPEEGETSSGDDDNSRDTAVREVFTTTTKTKRYENWINSAKDH